MKAELIRCLKAGILSGIIIGIILGVVGALFLYSSFLSTQSTIHVIGEISGEGAGIMTHENFQKEMAFGVITIVLISVPISYLLISIIISVLLSLLKSKLTYTKVIIAYLLIFGIISFPLFQTDFLDVIYLGESGISLVWGGIYLLIFSLPGSVLFYYFWKKFETKKPKNHDESKIKEQEETYD